MSMIRIFAQHPTASNLVLALMIVCGLAATQVLNRQFFPDFGLDYVTVSIVWPGASALDVDESLVNSIEPVVRFIDGVKKVSSSSYEGLANITIEFESSHDMQLGLAEVESAVGQITTLPLDSEKPRIKRLLRYETVSKLVLSGAHSERALKHYAKKVRDHLLSKGIDKIDLFGDRSEEIWVAVEPKILQKFDLTVGDISEQIRNQSQDLPAGEIAGGERQVRSLGLKKEAIDLETLELKSLPDGSKMLLKDIAVVSEQFEDGQKRAFRKGELAIEFDIQRATNSDALDASEIIRSELDEIRSFLPNDLKIETYNVQSNLIKERINLLVSNGMSGLLLVLIILFLFMSPRVALWVAIGIPASILAALAIMWASDQTINMLSLFGMIMAIGIVVDDAIVVGEHADHRFKTGLSSLEAAVVGAERMAVPVLSATLTTIAAFLPLFVISGIIGQIISAIPFVVIAILIASLIECFLVLPAHLSYGLGRAKKESGKFGSFRSKVDNSLIKFRKEQFEPLVKKAVENRYFTVSIAAMIFMISIGSVMGGHVGYQFFPSPEPNTIYANVRMLPGSTQEETRSAVLEVETALYDGLKKAGQNPEELVVMSLGRLGTLAMTGGSLSAVSSDSLGGVVVELTSSEFRQIKSSEVIAIWREETVWPSGVENLTFEAQRSGPPGGDMDIRLRTNGGEITLLKKAAGELGTLLGRYDGVSDVDDNMPFGKPEILLELNERGRALGFSTSSVARQVRDLIDGSISIRFPRGEEEITVRVRLEKDSVDNSILQNVLLRSSDGKKIPLKEIVNFSYSKGFSRIKRENGFKEIAVSAEIDSSITRSSYVQRALLDDGLRNIGDRYGVEWSFEGRAREQRETMSDMILGASLGFALIYIILAWVFSSYSRPFVVMAIVPLGFVGAVLGHGVLGFDLTILSIFAILGLSGIIINDSIVLVTTINERAKESSLIEAVVSGSGDRLRAVFLTSATTIGGLTPLLFETSLQAQFLIPMAITLVFGMALATFIVLFIVPSVVFIEQDIKKAMERVFQRIQRYSARNLEGS